VTGGRREMHGRFWRESENLEDLGSDGQVILKYVDYEGGKKVRLE
jgi:phosphoribosylformylglycinamidine (FGAM) synthase-like amidotransferase family enzyme